MRHAATVLAVVCMALMPAAAHAADWSTMPSPSPSSTYADLTAVSCTSASACTAVGSGTAGLSGGSSVPLAERWDGSSWTVEPTPLPSGASSMQLSAVSCASQTSCIAIGSGLQNDVGVLMADRWDGSTWTATTIADPPGTSDTYLRGVSCISSTDCTAAGGYSNGSGDEGAIVEHWDGISWTPQTVPALPAGSTDVQINAVACVPGNASDVCTLVGDYNDPNNGVIPLVEGENWGGPSGWQAQSAPMPDTGVAGQLKAVACPSTANCFATGTYYDPNSGDYPTLAEHRDGSAWSVQSAPSISDPFGGGSDINGISCNSSTSCTTVGYSGYGMAVLHWDGSSWTAQNAATAATGYGNGYLGGVGCAPGAPNDECTAVGFYYDSAQYNGAQINQALAIQWDGSAWASSGPVTPPGRLGGSQLASVSCSSTSACAAVGFDAGFSWSLPATEVWDGTSWTLRHAPAPTTSGGWLGSRFTSVSCAAAYACTAVGYSSYNSASGQPLAEHWNGTSWSMDAVSGVPAPSDGNSPVLDAVSCWSADGCIAVGTYNSTGAGGLAETWNGSSWTTRALPTPADLPTGGVLHPDAISCRSDSGAVTCMAVGEYDYFDANTSSSHYLPVAEHWDGSSWTAESVPVPDLVSVGNLAGVSCGSAGTCMAVGRYVDQSNDDVPLADLWSNGSWSLGSAVGPSAGGSSELESVSCVSATACTAVGHHIDVAHSMTEAWNGSTWALQTPDPGIAAGLFGVSCPSASVCIATGSAGDGSTLVESEGVASTSPNTLAVSMAGAGTGSVTGTGIDCSAHDMCRDGYGSGATITLTATPDSGSTFAGWSGSGCSGTGSCTVTMSADRDVTASFAVAPPPPPDTTPPTISITTPTADAHYTQNQVVLASYSCTDQDSGVESCIGTVRNGYPLDTSTAGQHNLMVTSRDNAGNDASQNVYYVVDPPSSTSGGSGTSGGGPNTSTSTSTSTPPPPTVVTVPLTQAIVDAIDKLLATAGASATVIEKSGGETVTFTAPAAGTIVINLYLGAPPAPPQGATAASKKKRKPVVVAKLAHTVKAGPQKLFVKLTPAGRKLLKHGKGLKVSERVVFTPAGGEPVYSTKTFKLKK